jgi:uncharacterized protein
MMRPRFDRPFEELPRTLPIFPLTGVVLLPGGRLPLNIFEPRYLNMTLDALADARSVGMLQPRDASADLMGEPPVYKVGCLGRIVAFKETEHARLLIELLGVCRFDILEEIERQNGYRQARVSYDRFRADTEPVQIGQFDRARFLAGLKPFLARHNLNIDWAQIEKISPAGLATTLAMICPFAPNEKQALLECRTVEDRLRTMTTLFEMAVTIAPDTPRH